MKKFEQRQEARVLMESGGSRFFPEGGANSQSGCAKPVILQIFAKNRLKMKEFGSRGGARPWRPPAPLGSAN